MNAEVKPIGPGLYPDMPNEAYHVAPGVSKSVLDMVAEDPSMVPWYRSAPVDEEKTKALDMGQALHTILLEPDEYEARFIVAPEFNRRTNAGKEEEAAFLKKCEDTGKTVMSAEDGRKLQLMRDSVMAHPTARWFFEQDGFSEQSIFWSDEETGELCRCRPDRRLANLPFVGDVKKVDGIERFQRHAEEFRYHVQDAMYSDGFHNEFGAWPTFLFIAVSSTVNCGRYPVRVFELSADFKAAGHELYRRDLQTYHRCSANNDWIHKVTLERPYWAR
ncbi:hypothetical protein GCM10011348_46300 [Marinobacterium nitratireducens]|uniref:Putative exodeoxyribonuclease 8 PDDEXK-like domain-containing protein n=1 Tax=Marinobacterium nitratireducens TaxID=518897 RepID=A0A917ZS36_9GAMM|nr:PD-(D/E)XK nuclease-like domain-containing protein [Marinobacterium nitratireducens]GGO89172.1 hypothetical protein GCM10011348_46300 [Marinobacterium nitratireducens]